MAGIVSSYSDVKPSRSHHSLPAPPPGGVSAMLRAFPGAACGEFTVCPICTTVIPGSDNYAHFIAAETEPATQSDFQRSHAQACGLRVQAPHLSVALPRWLFRSPCPSSCTGGLQASTSVSPWIEGNPHHSSFPPPAIGGFLPTGVLRL